MYDIIFDNINMNQVGGLAQLVNRVLSMHELAGSIPAFSSKTMLALRTQLGERQTEEKIISHLKAPCSIHGQSNF